MCIDINERGGRMREVVKVNGCRTPVGRRKGALTNYRADELFANVWEDLMERVHVNKSIRGDVIDRGVREMEEQGMNIARTSVLKVGFATDVQCVAIERQ